MSDTGRAVRGHEGPLRIFIGFDPRQAVSYNVLQQSLAIRSTKPVAITPLIIQQLPLERTGLTPFTWSRFLVPYLCGFKGWGLFLDADMICLDDISKLFELKNKKHAVMAADVRADFERASLMLFNCAHPDNKKLTPEYIEEASGLHALKWTEKVGWLPEEWNHIVFYDPPKEGAKLVHYTAGIPAFPEVSGCEYTDEWMRDAQYMNSAQPWQELMGNSRHVEKVQNFQRQRNAQAPTIRPATSEQVSKFA